MKKLVLVAVMSLGSLTAFAQETEAISTEATEVATEATEAVTEEVAVATEEAVEAQDGFNEVALEEVPEAITTALEAAHPGATISKAYANEDAQYKIEVAKADGETAELYADAEGNWIEM
ncbi:hypothetical protein JQC67_01655 [Aurantibacter crassamenti]|uniref:hypothetical protein n=1 Tax=Aurantibacter crassamenti TaxID=1837375 RepID=UPI00193A40FB|nr:hypothetical protein [Aurantibacter crassamenti]MBM1104832.1 hypothetical protein [Aurantibacter crassamenti]